MNRVVSIIIYIIVLCWNVNFYFCKTCSKTYVWWKDLFGESIGLDWLPLFYSIGLFLSLTIFLKSRLLRAALILIAGLNIIYWIYSLYNLGSFYAKYELLILIYMFLIYYLLPIDPHKI